MCLLNGLYNILIDLEFRGIEEKLTIYKESKTRGFRNLHLLEKYNACKFVTDLVGLSLREGKSYRVLNFCFDCLRLENGLEFESFKLWHKVYINRT